ncbi:MAG: SMEK domain-containing protein [Candidatus Pacebacteria bacterium]|nr:SMEK domain-containing protein [Candidatus Paceibacterota bacterium]
MNRSNYFDYIEDKICTLATRIDKRGKLNILNLHLHSENFYRDFFNILFDWELENLNEFKQNVEAIDLIDDVNKIIIQVSATCTKDKINSALEKKIIEEYKDYNFKFISISKDASNLRKENYTNSYQISFDSTNDIYDTISILKKISSLDIDNQKKIYNFIKKELGQEVDIEKLDSNLAAIINILSKENLDKNNQSITTDDFEIEHKISFNNLNTAKHIIDDYSIHYNRVDEIYSEYDRLGVNKSSPVLATIRKEYIKNIKIKEEDELFFAVIDNVQEKIIQSANFIKIPSDVLEVCVNILVVDAFIRCKIFENPKNYKHVITR